MFYFNRFSQEKQPLFDVFFTVKHLHLPPIRLCNEKHFTVLAAQWFYSPEATAIITRYEESRV